MHGLIVSTPSVENNAVYNATPQVQPHSQNYILVPLFIIYLEMQIFNDFIALMGMLVILAAFMTKHLLPNPIE